eukprot:COSAG06_NODE_2740_length_6360_cov_4.271362_2_plen_63_part_00
MAHKDRFLTHSSSSTQAPAPAEPQALQEIVSLFSSFPLCLSRACLGKMILFNAKKEMRFLLT